MAPKTRTKNNNTEAEQATAKKTEKPEQRPRSARAAKLAADKENEKPAAVTRSSRTAGVKKQSKTTTTKKATAAKAPTKKRQPKRKAAVAAEKKKKKSASATSTTPASSKKSSRAPRVPPSRDKVAEGRVDTILEQLPLNVLHEMCNTIRVSTALTKRQCADNILAWCTSQGERHLIESLEKEVLKETVKAFEGPVAHDNKGKLQSSMRRGLAEKGQEAVFGKLSPKLLDQLTKVFDFEEEGGKEAKVIALVQEIALWGAMEAFDKMKSGWIGEVAALFGIPKSSKGSTKHTTAKKILGIAFAHLAEEAAEEEQRRAKGLPAPGKEEEEEAEEEAAPVEKKPIEKGITQLELYQYYVGELVDYCKKNKLKVSGSKRDIIKRILAYLGGDIEGTRALNPAEVAQRRKKEAAKRKSQATAASTAKASGGSEAKKRKTK